MFDDPDDFDIPDYCYTDTGIWAGSSIKGMSTSHLKNAIAFAQRKGYSESKIKELEAELATREPVLIQKNEFEVDEAMILEQVKTHGVKIPASGAGVYFVIRGETFRLTEGRLYVRFDKEVRPTHQNRGKKTGRSKRKQS